MASPHYKNGRCSQSIKQKKKTRYVNFFALKTRIFNPQIPKSWLQQNSKPIENKLFQIISQILI
jgi:hypothetical protein